MHCANVASGVYPDPFLKTNMLRERTALIILFLPFVGWAIADGEWLYLISIGSVLCLAGFEYGLIFRKKGLRPALPLLILGVIILAVSRFLFGFDHAPLLLTVLCLASQMWHLVDYERGAPHSGTDFAITLTGIIYLGWVGSYLISLRRMPEGMWWLLVVLPSIWLADGAAYVVGRAIGRHKLAHRLSPNKTWEGYLAGVVFGTLGTVGLAVLWRFGSGPASSLSAARSWILGVTISVLAPFGDLGISMIKRETQIKDTGTMLPGHGGILDRLDSWLWAAAIGFYMVSWLTA